MLPQKEPPDEAPNHFGLGMASEDYEIVKFVTSGGNYKEWTIFLQVRLLIEYCTGGYETNCIDLFSHRLIGEKRFIPNDGCIKSSFTRFGTVLATAALCEPARQLY